MQHNVTWFTTGWAKFNSLAFLQTKTTHSQVLTAEPTCSCNYTNNTMTVHWCSWPKQSRVPWNWNRSRLILSAKKAKKKSEQCFWSSVSMAKARLMALGGFKVCPFFQSWHIICPRCGQQEDVQHVAHTWSQIQVHKRSTRGSYDSVTHKLMCQLSKTSIFLHTQHWLSFLLPQQFTFSLSLHPI